jgi:hypothetical protein
MTVTTYYEDGREVVYCMDVYGHPYVGRVLRRTPTGRLVVRRGADQELTFMPDGLERGNRGEWRWARVVTREAYAEAQAALRRIRAYTAVSSALADLTQTRGRMTVSRTQLLDLAERLEAHASALRDAAGGVP